MLFVSENQGAQFQIQVYLNMLCLKDHKYYQTRSGGNQRSMSDFYLPNGESTSECETNRALEHMQVLVVQGHLQNETLWILVLLAQSRDTT